MIENKSEILSDVIFIINIWKLSIFDIIIQSMKQQWQFLFNKWLCIFKIRKSSLISREWEFCAFPLEKGFTKILRNEFFVQNASSQPESGLFDFLPELFLFLIKIFLLNFWQNLLFLFEMNSFYLAISEVKLFSFTQLSFYQKQII